MEESKRDVVNSYDTLGGRIYDIRYAKEQESKYRILLARSQPGASDITLDVGCGTGLLLDRLNSRNVGLDISSSLLSTARSKVARQSKDELIQADTENLPFRAMVFHRVYSVTLIQNTPNPRRAIIEMKRVGKKNSKLAITALKKAFSLDQFESLLKEADLEFTILLAENEMKDWFAVADL